MHCGQYRRDAPLPTIKTSKSSVALVQAGHPIFSTWRRHIVSANANPTVPRSWTAKHSQQVALLRDVIVYSWNVLGLVHPSNLTYQFYPHLSLPWRCNCNITYYYHWNVLIGRICCTSPFNCSGNSTDNRTDRNNTFCGPADFNSDVYHHERMVGKLFTV